MTFEAPAPQSLRSPQCPLKGTPNRERRRQFASASSRWNCSRISLSSSLLHTTCPRLTAAYPWGTSLKKLTRSHPEKSGGARGGQGSHVQVVWYDMTFHRDPAGHGSPQGRNCHAKPALTTCQLIMDFRVADCTLKIGSAPDERTRRDHRARQGRRSPCFVTEDPRGVDEQTLHGVQRK